MTAVNPKLAALSEADRQALESWLVEFDQSWDESLLKRQVEQIPPSSAWRLPALAEMVKIDLERQWQRGRQVSLESYLKEFPELGHPADVSADLIQAEYEVRRQFGAPAALEDYLRRFPNQAGALALLIAQGGSSLSRRSSFGGPKPVENPQELPEQFGRYRILKRLGQGGMGSVYLAEDVQLQRRVALKVANYGTQDGPDARKRLLSEARAAATLDHPYLCPVYDTGENDGRLYLTMAYIDGQSLAESTRGKTLPQRQVAALVGKLAVALQEAHAKGVIHRDLKPSNVMIKSTGQRREPVIVDFGLARRDNPGEARLTRTGQVMGTLDYMAPEQLRGDLKEIGPASDIYALGVILYELLTGRLPFFGSGLAVVGQILTQPPLPPSTFRTDLDPVLEAICLKAMAKPVASRYASMTALGLALTEYLRAPAAAVEPSAPAPAPADPARRPTGSNTLVNQFLEQVVTNPASTAVTPATLPPGLADHPDYTIKKELGRGGMGVVYLAHNTLMGRDEVLKVMGRQIMERPEVLERFLREIRAVAKLRHPNIVTAYSATRLGDSIVFAMEYVDGLDLSRLVQAKGPMPVAHACLFAQQAALGLQHAHDEGLVHRDIKPANLMLSRKGDKATVKILDFGLAKAAREEKVDGALTSAGQALGTPDYIAPEQIINAPTADIRADVYSLGGTLYYLLTGGPPFQANSLYDLYQAHISRDAGPLNRIRPDVPAELAALVAKMMAKDPSQRFQTPGEVAQALAPFIKNANAVLKSPKADVAQTGRTPAEAGYAATQMETEADRLRGRPKPASVSPGGESRWESMVDFRETESSVEAEPEGAPAGRPSWLWPSVAVGVLVLGLFAVWLGGVFKVKTPDGVIVLENVPKDSEILVDGNKISFTWPGLGKPLEIRAIPGQHQVEVKKDGFSTFVKEARFKTDESEEITVRLEPLVVARPEPKNETTPEAKADKSSEPKTEVPVPRPATADAVASGFVSLFNGKDLSGWRTHPSQPGNWRVQDDILVGSGPRVSYLYTERGDYRDFHLRVEARINGGGNSGVWFRTSFGPFVPESNPEFPLGYEAQINSTHQDHNKTGSLLRGAGDELVSVEQSQHFSGGWFVLEIIAEGNHFIIRVNGKTTADYIDVRWPTYTGHIALQQLNPAAVAEFRKMEIKELNAEKVPGTANSIEQNIVPIVRVGSERTEIPLFNGKNLRGWHGDSVHWSVQDGAITGTLTSKTMFKGFNTYLVWQGGEPSDFELRLKFRIQGGNSGIQYRSKILDPVKVIVGGYQAEIDPSPRGYTGGNYDEKGGRTFLAYPGEKVTIGPSGQKSAESLGNRNPPRINHDEWNDYKITVFGNGLTHVINGVKVCEVIDNELGKASNSGVVAIQLHGGQPMTIQIKDIWLKDLTSK